MSKPLAKFTFTRQRYNFSSENEDDDLALCLTTFYDVVNIPREVKHIEVHILAHKPKGENFFTLFRGDTLHCSYPYEETEWFVRDWEGARRKFYIGIDLKLNQLAKRKVGGGELSNPRKKMYVVVWSLPSE